jgi:hypothetical protein
LINGHYYKVDYTPNVSNLNSAQLSQNTTSITYITNISEKNSITTAMETTVHEDWICEYVTYINNSVIVKIFRKGLFVLNAKDLRL